MVVVPMLRLFDPAAHEALIALEERARELVVAETLAGAPTEWCWGALVRHLDDAAECSRGDACSAGTHLTETACAVFSGCVRCAPGPYAL